QSSRAHHILIQMKGLNSRLISVAYVLKNKRMTSHHGLTRNGFCSEEKAFLLGHVMPWGISKRELVAECAHLSSRRRRGTFQNGERETNTIGIKLPDGLNQDKLADGRKAQSARGENIRLQDIRI